MGDNEDRNIKKELLEFLTKKDDKLLSTEIPQIPSTEIPLEFEWDSPAKDKPITLSLDEPETKNTKDDKVKTVQNPSVVSGIPQSDRGKAIFNEVNTLVAGTEAVKVAQARISTLEKERDALRGETEKLVVSAESLQRRMGELKSQNESLERKYKQKVEILEEEKAVLEGRLKAREQELVAYKKSNEELEFQFKNDLKRVRIRERELENRNELIKIEMQAVLKAKDDLILDLKRQIEQVGSELENFKLHSADLDSKINEFYERNNRTVKALRLALSVLEVGDNEDKPKKATG